MVQKNGEPWDKQLGTLRKKLDFLVDIFCPGKDGKFVWFYTTTNISLYIYMDIWIHIYYIERIRILISKNISYTYILINSQHVLINLLNHPKHTSRDIGAVIEDTPWKTNMAPTNRPFRKENYLPIKPP